MRILIIILIVLKTPYVCNGCKSRSGCRKERYTYYARKADDTYKEVKSQARRGINLTPEEVYKINITLTPLIKKNKLLIIYILIILIF